MKEKKIRQEGFLKNASWLYGQIRGQQVHFLSIDIIFNITFL